ncbi:MAG: helix-turn-helix domain-containing protein [Lachnospiraceae bacterium]|nr:helix-turn-helix domain-containing protein [Lachnospiraceae bacterium]
MADTLKKEELMVLANRMIRLRYSIDSNHMEKVFRDISIADYVVLMRLSRKMGIHEPEAKVYLSDISKELEIPINRVSQMVQNLQNKGYVYWEHDVQGTYIYLSEIGSEAMKKQQTILSKFIRNVIDRMGWEEFVHVLDEMNELELIIEAEADNLSDDE